MASSLEIPVGCLETEALMSLVEGRLDEATRSGLLDHAAGCETCRELLSTLARDHATTEEPLATSTQIDRYAITRVIGSGAMGVVYAAHDPELDRTVAIKVLRGEGDPELQDRLRREAQTMAKLAHPNVIAVYDAGVFEGRNFIAMEYVDGVTLAHWLATPRSARAILDAYRAAGRGLAAGHEAGIVHRDFKPENVLIDTSGRVRVGDFGLARATRGTPPSSAENLELTSFAGTPAYMAPEVLAGAQASARSDQFSFCVALFAGLYGERPYAGATIAELRTSMRAGTLARPQVAQVPRRVRRAIERGLAPDPADRFGSLRELLDILDLRPPRTALWLGAAASLVALTWLVTRLATTPPPAVCTGASAAFAATWNDQRRAAIASAFAATRVPYASMSLAKVSASLDGYAHAWIDAHTATCRATRVLGEQSESILDLRMSCLERRRVEASAMIDALSTIDAASLARSVTAVVDLGDVADCADVAGLAVAAPPPGGLATRARLAALRRQLADAHAKYELGAYKAAAEPARAVVTGATAVGYLPFTAEAELLEGTIEAGLGDLSGSEHSFDTAVWSAEASKSDAIAARTWVQLVALVGYKKGEIVRGLAYVPRATAAIARLGGHAEIESQLELSLGAIDFEQANYVAAQAHEAKALALAEHRFGSDHLTVATALESLATTTAQLGDRAGIAELDRARAIYERVLGEGHPSVARVLSNLGIAYLQAGDYPNAERILRRSLAMREALLGPEHPDLSSTLSALGSALAAQGKNSEALAFQRRAVAITDKAFGPDGLELVNPLIIVADSLASAGENAEADAALVRAQAVATKRLGPTHPYAILPLVALGHIRMAQARWRDAMALYERAIPALANVPGHQMDRASAIAHLARAYEELGQPARALAVSAPLLATLDAMPIEGRVLVEITRARAMWNSGGDRSVARASATTALTELRAHAPPNKAAIEMIEHWLALHSDRAKR